MSLLRSSLLWLLASLSATSGLADGDDLRASIANALVRLEGNHFVAHRWEKEPEIVALYFGADWCAPCHAFQPRLREVYDRLRAQGASTEIVFVSLDHTARDMRRTILRHAMSWPALDHRRLPSLPEVRLLAGKGPPNLVLLDRDGRVLASAWEGDTYIGPSAVLARWLAHFPVPTPSP